MMKYIQYLSYVLRHRWFVFLECYKVGLVWQGIIHDLSKFLPSEFFPYANYFYGSSHNCLACEHMIREGGYCDINFSGIGDGEQAKNCKDYTTKGFDLAWLLHQKRNKHHWQWWVLIRDNDDDKGEYTILDIPLKYKKELLCDWRGAGKAQGYGDNTLQWFHKNKTKMKLHPNTKKWLESQLYLPKRSL